MIESVFYFQITVFFILLAYGLARRSASFLALAGVFGMLTGVMLTGDGIDYPSGYTITGTDSDQNTMGVQLDYEKHTAYNDQALNMWHYVLLYGSFIWIIMALLLAVKGQQGEDIESL